jgi:(p)ppGpp synthase/HD superfamily hydrolase
LATLADAVDVASSVHAGRTDPCGTPHIDGLLTVMTLVVTEEEKIVAVFRDIAAGTGVTAEDLRRLGFSPRVIGAVGALTRRDSDTLEQWIGRIAREKTGLALTVASAALAFESRPERQAGLDDFTRLRLQRERERAAALLGTSIEALLVQFDHSPYDRGVDGR